MSIKAFGKGLGLKSSAVNDSSVLTGMSFAMLGNLSVGSTIMALANQLGQEINSTLSNIIGKIGDIRGNVDLIELEKHREFINEDVSVMSLESSLAPFETLYSDFNFTAEPHYNFWTVDELTNASDLLGDRDLSDVPRYIFLSWDKAPALEDPDEMLAPSTKTSRNIEPVKLGILTEVPETSMNMGIIFSQDHVNPSEFSGIKQFIANGYLAPGILEAILDLPLDSAGLKNSKNATDLIDEISFLENSKYNGVSIYELIQQGQTADGISKMMSNGSQDVTSTRKIIGDSIDISDAGSNISISVKNSVSTRDQGLNNVEELIENITVPQFKGMNREVAHTKVKFVNTALSGLVDAKRLSSARSPEHVESIISIASLISNLEMASAGAISKESHITVPSIPTAVMRRNEYIGYVIEKYVLDKRTGTFLKVTEIDIPSRDVNNYVDTQVTYGTIYRYRIKSIMRWVKEYGLGITHDEHVTSGFDPSQILSLTKGDAIFIASEWSEKWAYSMCIDTTNPDPPDELTVRPESFRKRVVVTCKLPDNSQKDISAMLILRKIRYDDGSETDWQELLMRMGTKATRNKFFPPNNVIFFDEDVDMYLLQNATYIYAAQCFSRHGESSVLSPQLACRLNADYKITGEIPVQMISCKGVKREYFGAFSTIPHKITKTDVIMKTSKTSNSLMSTQLDITGRDTITPASVNDSSYIMRVLSLDTGESIDVPIDIVYTNLPTREIVEKTEVYATHDVTVRNDTKTELILLISAEKGLNPIDRPPPGARYMGKIR